MIVSLFRLEIGCYPLGHPVIRSMRWPTWFLKYSKYGEYCFIIISAVGDFDTVTASFAFTITFGRVDCVVYTDLSIMASDSRSGVYLWFHSQFSDCCIELHLHSITRCHFPCSTFWFNGVCLQSTCWDRSTHFLVERI